MGVIITEQLRRAAEQAALYTNDTKDADARLEQEARHEEKIIQAVCDDLGLVMCEVSSSYCVRSTHLTFKVSRPDQPRWTLFVCRRCRSVARAQHHPAGSFSLCNDTSRRGPFHGYTSRRVLAFPTEHRG